MGLQGKIYFISVYKARTLHQLNAQTNRTIEETVDNNGFNGTKDPTNNVLLRGLLLMYEKKIGAHNLNFPNMRPTQALKEI